MIWKLQPSPIFFVPVPYNGQSIMDLTAWQFSPDIKPDIMELTNPDETTYKVEILDCLGPYPMERIPTFLARCIGGKGLTGKLLAALLRKKKPEFLQASTVLFYQGNPLKDDNKEITGDGTGAND
jgi:hypothetical protein